MSNLKEPIETPACVPDNQAQWEQLDELLGNAPVSPLRETGGHVCCGRHGQGGCGCGGLHHNSNLDEN